MRKRAGNAPPPFLRKSENTLISTPFFPGFETRKLVCDSSDTGNIKKSSDKPRMKSQIYDATIWKKTNAGCHTTCSLSERTLATHVSGIKESQDKKKQMQGRGKRILSV